MRIEHHPKLNIWVREDGCVYLPQSGTNPAHWTYGYTNNQGYRKVRIGGKEYRVNRLVAETFIGPISEGMEVDHIDRNPLNNSSSNLRIVTHSENMRNTPQNDRVEARGGTHWYADKKQYNRESAARCYVNNKDKIRERRTQCYQAKRKTHKYMQFADGRQRWVPNEEAEVLLAIPLKERIFKGTNP